MQRSNKTETVTAVKLARSIKKYLNILAKDPTKIIVIRRRGKNEAVILSIKEYERLKANDKEFQKNKELQKCLKGVQLAQKRGNYEIV